MSGGGVRVLKTRFLGPKDIWAYMVESLGVLRYEDGKIEIRGVRTQDGERSSNRRRILATIVAVAFLSATQ